MLYICIVYSKTSFQITTFLDFLLGSSWCSLYRSCSAYNNSTIDEAKAEVQRLGIDKLGRHDDVEIAHYSFDYAQNIHIPSDPMQVGPLFFLTPKKVGIFGVCAEAIPCQVIPLLLENILI